LTPGFVTRAPDACAEEPASSAPLNAAQTSQTAQTAQPASRGQALVGLFWLVALSLLGQGLAMSFAPAVPGSVIGMLLLLLALCVIRRVPEPIAQASRTLIGLLPLFVVPAGVGVIEQSGLGLHDLAAIAVGVLVSTGVGLIAAGRIAERQVR